MMKIRLLKWLKNLLEPKPLPPWKGSHNCSSRYIYSKKYKRRIRGKIIITILDFGMCKWCGRIAPMLKKTKVIKLRKKGHEK